MMHQANAFAAIDDAPGTTKPLRVLMISHSCQSRTEGQAKAEAIAKFHDIELRVLTPDRWLHYGRWRSPAPIADTSGFSMQAGRVALPWAGPAQFYLHWYPELRRVLEEFRPDIIDIWEEPWGLVTAHACWLRNRVLPSAKIIIETEQNLYKRLPPPFGWFRSYSLANADHVIARSAEAADVLRRIGYRGAATVVPNGVDTRVFSIPDPSQRAATRGALKMDGFVAAYVGRLVEEKGVLDAIDAVADCPGDVGLVIVGEGPVREVIADRIAIKNLAGRVRLLGPWRFEDLPALLGAADVLLLPSRTTRRWKEQFGRVIIEAHACGTPVIGSNSGAIPQVVDAGGLIFAEGNIAELSSAIMALRDNRTLGQSLGAAGAAQVAERYSWGRVAEQMRSIYQCLAPAHV